MMKYFVSAVCVAVVCGVVLSQSVKKRMAVSAFIDYSETGELDNKTGKRISRMMEKALTVKDHFEVRSSASTDKFMNDLSRAQAGIVPVQNLRGASHALDVDYILIGSVHRVGGSYEVFSRIVNVETMNVAYAKGITCDSPQSAPTLLFPELESNFNTIDSSSSVVGKPNVAVYGFKGLNSAAVVKSAGSRFAESVTTELGAEIDVAVTEYRIANAAANGKRLEMAGVTDNEESDFSFTGKGIDYILSGTIRAFPDMICISWNIRESQSKRPGYIGYSEVNSESMLRLSAENIAKIAAGHISRKPGYVDLDIVPSDARIFVDGKETEGTTKLLSLEAGKHTLVFERDGYLKKDISLVVESRITRRVSIRMDMSTGVRPSR